MTNQTLIHKTFLLFGLLFLMKDVAFAQDSKPVSTVSKCERLKAPDRNSLSKDEYRTRLFDLSSCPEGADKLVQLWKVSSPPEVRYLRIASLMNPSRSILSEVTRVARDSRLPETTRLEALQVMMGYAMPSFAEFNLDSDTSAQKNVNPELIKLDPLIRRHWVRVSITPHRYSETHLAGATKQVLRDFDIIMKSEPETRVGKVVDALIYWLRKSTN